MNVGSIAVNNSGQSNKVNFSAQHEHRKGGAGKAWSSAFIPGLGQFFDGRNAAGFGFLGGMLGLNLLSAHVNKDVYTPLWKGNFEEYFKRVANMYSKPGRFEKNALIGFATLGLWLANVVDAYKGGKS